MINCTDIFWHEFYKAAGITLGLLLPLALLWGDVMLALFRQHHRHEERMQEARRRDFPRREENEEPSLTELRIDLGVRVRWDDRLVDIA